MQFDAIGSTTRKEDTSIPDFSNHLTLDKTSIALNNHNMLSATFIKKIGNNNHYININPNYVSDVETIYKKIARSYKPTFPDTVHGNTFTAKTGSILHSFSYNTEGKKGILQGISNQNIKALEEASKKQGAEQPSIPPDIFSHLFMRDALEHADLDNQIRIHARANDLTIDQPTHEDIESAIAPFIHHSELTKNETYTFEEALAIIAPDAPEIYYPLETQSDAVRQMLAHSFPNSVPDEWKTIRNTDTASQQTLATRYPTLVPGEWRALRPAPANA